MKKEKKNQKQRKSSQLQQIMSRDTGVIAVLLFVVAFVLYGNTIPFGYALDDKIVVTDNEYVKQGLPGIPKIMSTDTFAGALGEKMNLVTGGRYRPLSLVTFAMEVQLFGLNPHVSHTINILLYGLTAMLLYLLVLKFLALRSNGGAWYVSVPFLTALLFLVHPLHTEVVANIKGRDEILSLLFSLAATLAAFRTLETKRSIHAVGTAILFLLGLLSKENTVTFLFVIPLAIFFFTKHPLRKQPVLWISLGASVLVFLLLRQSSAHGITGEAQGDIMNNPFLRMTGLQKYATILYTLGLYIQLLFIPHPLTHDYYPYHIPIVNPAEFAAILPFLMYGGLIVFASMNFRKKSVPAFGIIYFLATLSIVSNVVFPVGVFMSERFLFMPSVGFCLVFVYILADRLPLRFSRPRIPAAIILSLISLMVLLCTAKSISRNACWENDETLFASDVITSANSAKANFDYGSNIMKRAKAAKDGALNDSLLTRAEAYLQRAVAIHPGYIGALINLAAAYHRHEKNDSAIAICRRLAKINPDNDMAYRELFVVLGSCPDIEYRIRILKEFDRINPQRFDITYGTGVLLNVVMRYPEAAGFLKRAVQLKPADYNALINLGVALARSGEYTQALDAFRAAEKIQPDSPELLTNIGATYSALGNPALAAEYHQRARAAASKK
jgi:protein O-mannosyl-transferase